MDNVVYILGAGFSAPLGLPVMSNFLDKAHDIYEEYKEDYPNFKKVFDSIKVKLASIALVYDAKLDNIEEVLSILEMERLVGGISQIEAHEFHKFIIDVIKYFTPPVIGLENFIRVSKGIYKKTDKETEGNAKWDIISDNNHRSYGQFILGLFNAEIDVDGISEDQPLANRKKNEKLSSFRIVCKKSPLLQAKYSVISLNYDLVLENLAEYYSTISDGYEIKFSRPQTNVKDGFPVLAKLHGSIDTNTIIPPTWNKIIQEKIDLEWKAAYQLLSSAHQIRFIGYSLPDGDAYVKYLLKASSLSESSVS